MTLSTTYNFNVPSNYTYPAAIEITGGVAKLTSIDTPTNYIENFNDATGLTFGAEIEIAGGAHAQLVIENNPGQDFNEDFADDTGFTYNASNTEFSGGVVQQIQKDYRPVYYLGTFFAGYNTSINGDYGDGVLAGTAFGGAAISGGRLDLTGASKYVSYDADFNADSQQVGCLRFKVTPNYVGIPATTMRLISIAQSHGVVNNLLELSHFTTGEIKIDIYNNTGVAIVAFVSFGAWSQVSGTEYEFELNWDISSGATRLFIDGVQLGATLTQTGVRNTNIGLLRVGGGYAGAAFYDGYIDDVAIFNSPQHTANYVPAAYGLSDPKQPVFYAGYDEDVDGDWSDGTVTGVPVGGASVLAGKLELTYDDLRYVDYNSNVLPTDTSKKFCVRWEWSPNYSGTPLTPMVPFVWSDASLSNNGLTSFVHQATTGNLRINLWDEIATPLNIDFGVWSPVLGTEYEFELNVDLLNGRTRLFIDGVQFGATSASISSRVATPTYFRVGANSTLTLPSNFSINNILVFEYPQHITDYTPNWAGILPYEYYGDVITLPEMYYTGAGTLISFDSFPVTDVNAPRYTLQIGRSGNYLYWSGAAWVVSNNTFAQANTEATFAANLAALPILGEIYGQFRIYTQNNIGNQQNTGDLTASLTAQIYPITNPTIDIDLAITTTVIGETIVAWNSFAETITTIGSDAVTYCLSNDDGVSWRYYSGGWNPSSGAYAQSNSGTTIAANIGSFPKTAEGMKVRVFLHSNNGITTPIISNLVVNYDDYIYSTASPKIFPVSTIYMDGFSLFSSTTTEIGSDEVRYTLLVDTVEMYWNGTIWIAGGSYINSNTALEINTNVSSLEMSLGKYIKVVIYLHSDDGSTTPNIDQFQITYNIHGTAPGTPNECFVYGYIYDSEGNPMLGATVKSVLTSVGIYDTDILIARDINVATTDITGYWEISLVENANMQSGVGYTFTFIGEGMNNSYNKVVPNLTSVNFADLVNL